MNAKIIQLAVMPETEEAWGALVALTEDGRVFQRLNDRGTTEPDKWKEIETKNFVHRLGNLI